MGWFDDEEVRRTVFGDGNGWGLVQHIHGDGNGWGLWQHIMGTGKEGQEGLWGRLCQLEEKVERMHKMLEGDGNGWGLQQNIYGDGTNWGLMQHIHGDGQAWGLRQQVHGTGPDQKGLWGRLCMLEESLKEEREKNKALEAKLRELLIEAVNKQLADK